MFVMSDNLKGAALMVGSMTAFTINDAFMKAIAGELPLFQAMFLRGLGLVACLIGLCAAAGQLRPAVSVRDWWLVVLRGLAEVGGAVFFMTALFHMPLANVSAIMQATPLAVSLAGAIFLGEMLGWRRLLAILVGFLGVLLIVRPGGSDFSIFTLAAVGAVICVTFRDLAARRLSKDLPSLFAALVAAVLVTAFVGLASLLENWAPISTKAAAQLTGAMIFILGGYFFSVAAMRVGEVSFTAPFRYTSLLVALILGFVVFGDLPGPITLIGAGIVVVTGLFTLYREHKAKARHHQVPGRLR